MAKRTVVVDDLTGEPNARTRTIRFDGIDYEIDLTDANFAELRATLKRYLRAGRAVGGRPTGSRASTNGRKPAGASDAAAIRAWARSHNLPVTERGRVTAELRSQWQAAGSPR